MKLYLITALLIISIGNKSYAQSPEKLRVELQKDESHHPATYLKAINTKCENVVTQKQDLFHQQKIDKNRWNITGQIINYAAIASFKDVVLTVSFYTQTNTFLGSADFTIYQYLNPKGTIPFQIITNGPDAIGSYNVSVKSAIPIY
jgi:hypothetical protein